MTIDLERLAWNEALFIGVQMAQLRRQCGVVRAWRCSKTVANVIGAPRGPVALDRCVDRGHLRVSACATALRRPAKTAPAEPAGRKPRRRGSSSGGAATVWAAFDLCMTLLLFWAIQGVRRNGMFFGVGARLITFISYDMKVII